MMKLSVSLSDIAALLALVSLSDIIALFALAVAVWSLVQSVRFNRRQNAFAKTAERLNLLLIEKESAENENQRQADLSSNSYKVGKNYRLKIFNKGFGTAKNVRLEMLAGADVVLESDLLHKFPIPLLERHQVTELLLPVHMGSSSRVHMKLTWDDETGENRSKELWVDIF